MAIVLNAEMHVSDHVSGRPSRLRAAMRATLLLGLLGVIAGPVAPLATAANGLTVTTPFPAIVSEPGSTSTFELTINVPSAERVDLKASGVPQGWTARFKGGALTIDSVFVDPKTKPAVSLEVEIPADATPGTTTIAVTATGGGANDTLPLSIRVADAAPGDVSLTTDFPELKGPSTTDFTYNLTIHNDTSADITFTMDATGPDGWTVAAKPADQAQATSTQVKAGSTGSVTVTATPPTDVNAGAYPIQAGVSGGGKNAAIALQATVTGTYTMTVSTPDQVLSTSANAGSTTDLQMTVANTGSAPITNVVMSATPPTNWKVEFDPANIATIAAGQTQNVTAHITPSSDAIAGDYDMSVNAKGTEANDDVDIRVRVDTPQIWWIVGIVLIIAVFAGLYWVFRTYGRR